MKEQKLEEPRRAEKIEDSKRLYLISYVAKKKMCNLKQAQTTNNRGTYKEIKI